MRRVLRSKPIQVVLVAANVLLLAFLIRFHNPELLQVIRDVTFDEYQRIKPRSPPKLPIRIIDVDDDSIRRYGQWPWPRTKLAQIVDRLAELGASAVAFDMVFSESDRTDPAEAMKSLLQSLNSRDRDILSKIKDLPENDALFASSLSRVPTVLGFFATKQANPVRPPVKAGFVYAGDDPKPALVKMKGSIVSRPMLEKAAQGIGSVSLSADRVSDVIRTVPLFISDGTNLYPTLSMEALRVAVGASTYVIKAIGASGETTGGRSGMVSVKLGDFVVPTTAAGELQMYYKRYDPADYISVGRLLEGDADKLRPLVEGHIVFIGASAVGLSDLRIDALGQLIPGVSLHAQMVEQILTQTFLQRPDWADGAEIFMTVVVTLLVMAVLPYTNALYSAAFGAMCAAVVLAVSWLMFDRYGILIEPVFPMLTGAALYILTITFVFAAADRERRFVRSAFQYYLAPALLKKLEAAPEQLILGGEDRNLTILFMDIRGFTGISEKLSPNELVTFLNELFTPLSEIIQQNEGAIDKYIGDSIMAFWNAPVQVDDHPRKACHAALKMVEVVERLQRDDAFGFKRRSLDIPDVRIGIGLSTGDVCVGNMGSAIRFNYSVVGDTVNVSARIELETKAHGWPILVSETTALAAPDLAYLPVGNLVLKGKSHDIAIYALVGDEEFAKSPEFEAMKEKHEHGGTAALLPDVDGGSPSDTRPV